MNDASTSPPAVAADVAALDALRDRVAVVPLALILDRVRPAYGGRTWAEALAYLDADPAEAEVIASLVASLARTGATLFDAPIRVFQPEPDDDHEDHPEDRPEDGVCGVTSAAGDGAVWVIGNGMHRVAAAVATGSPSIRCTAADIPSVQQGVEEYVEVEFTLPVMPEGRDSDGLDDLNFVSGWLRSFPLPDGTWVESEGLGCHGMVFSAMWSCPSDRATELLAELQSRFARFAPSEVRGGLTVLSMRTCTGVQLDAEFAAEFGDGFDTTAIT